MNRKFQFRNFALGLAAGVSVFAVVQKLSRQETSEGARGRFDGFAEQGLAQSAGQTGRAFSPDESNTIAVFESVAPSVVFIDTTTVQRDFFSMSVMEVPRGSGSGFVWDTEGHIVTNFHVIERAASIKVTLQGGQVFPARLVGQEPDKDLALLKIDAPKSLLKTVTVGNTDSLKVGQKVLAIGNPFGLDQSLTVGVISALGREIQSQTGRRIQDVVQTDAAINPGNSGGPLLDSNGRVIGVNTQIYSPSGASAGIGFAVPVNAVKRVVPQLIKYGRTSRPVLGVRLVSDAIAQRNEIKGVIIESVEPGGPADQAGIIGLIRGRGGEVLVGDVIVGIGQKKVKNYSDLLDELERFKPGDAIDVRLRRGKDGKERAVTVKTRAK